jgi:hypothetical protein
MIIGDLNEIEGVADMYKTKASIDDFRPPTD